MNSQHENTNSKEEFVLKTGIDWIRQAKLELKKYIATCFNFKFDIRRVFENRDINYDPQTGFLAHAVEGRVKKLASFVFIQKQS